MYTYPNVVYIYDVFCIYTTCFKFVFFTFSTHLKHSFRTYAIQRSIGLLLFCLFSDFYIDEHDMVVHTVRSIGYQVDLDAYELQIALYIFSSYIIIIIIIINVLIYDIYINNSHIWFKYYNIILIIMLNCTSIDVVKKKKIIIIIIVRRL